MASPQAACQKKDARQLKTSPLSFSNFLHKISLQRLASRRVERHTRAHSAGDPCGEAVGSRESFQLG